MGLIVGNSASFTKTVTEADIVAYAGITGDFNPAHIDEVKANKGLFGERIAHGMLSAGFISTVLGTRLPGEGTIYLSQELRFLNPVKIGDTITAIAEIVEIVNPLKGIYKLRTFCKNQSNEVVVDGEAVVKYLDSISAEKAYEKESVIQSRQSRRNSFYSEEELAILGLASYGKNVLISKNAVLYNPEQVSVGNNVRIDDFTTISGKVVIGDYIHIAQFCGLYGGTDGIFMNDFSGLSSRVVIYATSNDYSGESMTNPMVPSEYKTGDKDAEVQLGKHVIIGTTSVVLPGVNIGIGCSVGAMSMVSKDCEPWGIYVGCPVRRVKERSRKLLALESQLRKNGGVFWSNIFSFQKHTCYRVKECAA